jgi:hypothetical protein
LTLNGKISSAY